MPLYRFRGPRGGGKARYARYARHIVLDYREWMGLMLACHTSYKVASVFDLLERRSLGDDYWTLEKLWRLDCADWISDREEHSVPISDWNLEDSEMRYM